MQFNTNIGKSFGYTTQIKDLTIVTKPSYYYLTSTIYPLEFLENLNTSAIEIDGRSNHKDDLGLYRYIQENTTSNFSEVSGTLKVALKVYSNYKEEKLSTSLTNVYGVLRLLLRSYTENKPENITSSFSSISGVLRSALILYLLYNPENVSSAISNLSSVYNSFQTSYESYIAGTEMIYKYPPAVSKALFTATVMSLYTPSQINKDPLVIIDQYTTSALDFENGIVDKIASTVWTKSGTADVTTTNKIFGNTSFETKVLGDGLSTPNVITGGSTPFTIEMYFLAKDFYQTLAGPSDIVIQYPLFSQSNSAAYGEQAVYIHKDTHTIQYYRQQSFSNVVPRASGKFKIKLNEINKITFTFDGSCSRFFLNDKLDFVIGTSQGWTTTTNPFMISDILVPSWSQYRTYFPGIIDNINIFDGEARVVRDYDEHADKLVVDLAFDGENNSTVIIDNSDKTASDKDQNNVVVFNNFDSSAVDQLGNTWQASSVSYETAAPISGTKSLKITTTTLGTYYSLPWSSNLNLSNKDFTIEFSFKYTSKSGASACLLSNRSSTANGNNWSFLFPTNYIQFQADDFATLTSTIPCLANTLYHVALTFTEKTLRLFINGVLAGTVQNITNTLRSASVPLNVGRLDGPGQSTHTVLGLYDNLRITRGVARYVEDYSPVNGFEYKLKNTWNVQGNAKISTIQKFDGFSSLALDGTGDYLTSIHNNYDISDKNFTIKCSFNLAQIKNNDNVIIDAMDNNVVKGWQLYVNSTGNLIFYDRSGSIGTIKAVLRSTKIIAINTAYNCTITREGNSFKMYINNILEVTNSGYIDFGTNIPINIGAQVNYRNTSYDLNGYIKSIKIYKDVVIVPEDPAGKIKLAFNNNLSDDYLNSTWTNTNVTFDQVNSVEGYAAKFNGGNSYLNCAANTNFNYGAGDYLLEMDYKRTTQTAPYGHGFFSNGYSNNQSSPDRCALLCSNATNNPLYSINGTQPSLPISEMSLDNVFYKIQQYRKGGTLITKANDVVGGAINVGTTSFNWNYNNLTTIGRAYYYSSLLFNGYLDNFKSIKGSNESTVVDKPAVHLPLETNNNNIGFTPLTINSVGGPIYTTINNKKCIKFQSGKYLYINSDNVFNLGLNSDFYMELDFYIPELHTTGYGHSILNNGLKNGLDGMWLQCLPSTAGVDSGKIELIKYTDATNYLSRKSVNSITVNAWNNLKFLRLGTTVKLILNGIETVFTNDISINFSQSNTHLGMIYGVSNEASLDGYMSNFKMFAGTSEVPETYNDKKVLSLDFKPTRKSYLFKDNNNKCVIHPVNITQRDYLDSKYCCTFNGTNQYLQLGKNDLFNFGNDDFVINIKFKVSSLTQDFTALLSSLTQTSNSGRCAVCIIGPNHTTESIRNCIYLQYNDTSGNYKEVFSSNPILLNSINDLIISRINNTISIKLNEIQTNKEIDNSWNYNFNLGNNTSIGQYTTTVYFTGTIYSVKVLRNTTDLSLLNEDPDEFLPISLTLNQPSSILNPEDGTYTTVFGDILNSIDTPEVTAIINGEQVNQNDITLIPKTTTDGSSSFEVQIKILNDNLDGTYVLEVTATDQSNSATSSVNIMVIRDYELPLAGIDSFNTNWYQNDINNLVIKRKVNEEMNLYFNGYSSLFSTNYSWRLGLDKFTIELAFVLNSYPTSTNYSLLSYGKTYTSSSWYSFDITSNRAIVFRDKGAGIKLSTVNNIVNIDTEYKLAITRDSNYVLRIFLNGIKVAEGIDNTNYDSNNSNFNSNNMVFIGNSFQGYMKEFYVNKGECLYTTDYTPSSSSKSLSTKSLMNFSTSDVGFVTKEDAFNTNIVWTNTGCTVVNNELILSGTSNRLTSNEVDMFNFNNQNWTIDMIATTSQITSEATLFDSRLSSSSFNGILIKQSASDPTSLTIYVGMSTETNKYTYTITTGVNTLIANKEFRLKIVKSVGEIIVFLDGVRKTRTSVTMDGITTNRSFCIGNDLSFTKGFNGKIKQFRIINGIATDVYTYPIKEGELLT